MAIEYNKQIQLTEESTIYAHQSLDEAGFPKDPGNAKVSQLLNLAENKTIGTLSSIVSFVKDDNDKLIYHFCIAGVPVASFSMPPDKFLKSVNFEEATKILTFIFITDTGITTIPIDLSSLIDTYKAGNGLLLNNGVFSLKISPNETRLIITSDGLSFDASSLIALVSQEETRAKNAEKVLADRIQVYDDYKTEIQGYVTTAQEESNKSKDYALSSQTFKDASVEASNISVAAANRASDLLNQADLNLIESIEQTKTSTVSGGINEVTITQKNQNKSVFQTRNGDKGEKGNDGVGYFDFDYDETTGDLYIVYDELGKVPNFEFDETNGDLYIVYEGV